MAAHPSIFTAAAEVCAQVENIDLETAIEILQQLKGDAQAAINFLKDGAPAAKRTKPSEQESTSADATHSAIKVLTWNVNGLDESPAKLKHRLDYVLNDIESANPDILIFQELTVYVVSRFQRVLTSLGYKHMRFAGVGAGYFTGFYSKYALDVKERYTFSKDARSHMGRGLFICACNIPGWPAFHVAVSHFESGKESAATRVAQAKQVVTCLESYPCVVFAADTNLRVKEGSQLKKHMAAIQLEDAFESLGQPSDARYTWDTQKNNNLGFTGPRCRFDQVWTRGVACSSMHLIGTTKRKHGHPSDHFGVLVDVRLKD
eukprot:TRINITY_DN12577_c1_g1_i5.p2 TRINITY_DN12577_c1_g1~~TRINITY_DN12577_c1_g1_i5.p2  ORF type:complete len:318 (+),score=42.48 TRINITY_DN12577_c1_g1_i5:2989-3942(+)